MKALLLVQESCFTLDNSEETVSEINSFIKSESVETNIYNVSADEEPNFSDLDSMESLSKFITKNKNKNSNIMVISNKEIHFLAFRLLVRNKIIHPEDLKIFFVNKHGVTFDLDIDETGKLECPWPDGLFDTRINLTSKLL